jgi:hypothetical protein
MLQITAVTKAVTPKTSNAIQGMGRLCSQSFMIPLPRKLVLKEAPP